MAALLLLAEVIIRFVYFLQLGSFSNYVLTFYFLFFGLYLIGFELGINYLKVKLYLMNFGWGKAMANVFIGSLVLSCWVVPALDVIIFIFYLAAAVVLAMVSCLFKEEEQARVEAEVKAIEEYREKQRAEAEAEARDRVARAEVARQQ